jgi:phosphomethylpyrimidine synthase
MAKGNNQKTSNDSGLNFAMGAIEWESDVAHASSPANSGGVPVGVAGFVMAKTKQSAHSFSMKITEDVRKYAAEQGIAEEEALQKGMEEKSKEFVEKGAAVYAKT